MQVESARPISNEMGMGNQVKEPSEPQRDQDNENGFVTFGAKKSDENMDSDSDSDDSSSSPTLRHSQPK